MWLQNFFSAILEGSEVDGIAEKWRGHVLDFINKKTGESQKQDLPGPGMDTDKVNWKQMGCGCSEKGAVILGSQRGVQQEWVKPN